MCRFQRISFESFFCAARWAGNRSMKRKIQFEYWWILGRIINNSANAFFMCENFYKKLRLHTGNWTDCRDGLQKKNRNQRRQVRSIFPIILNFNEYLQRRNKIEMLMTYPVGNLHTSLDDAMLDTFKMYFEASFPRL